VNDLVKDAKKFSLVHNNSLETHYAELVEGRVLKLIRQARVAAEGQRDHSRTKRNFIGNILHDVGGVATTDELAIEHRKIEELKGKVAYMLKKELSIYKAVSDVKATADNFEATKQEIGKLRWALASDGDYFARKVNIRLMSLQNVVY
jgi:single-stranded DNA-specific DHH superfamily exonuclease